MDISDNTDGSHSRAFNNSDGFNDFLFVESGSGSVDFSYDMGHTGFESAESGQVDWLGWVVLWEGLALTTVTACSLFWEKSQGTVSWMFKFTMRLFVKIDLLVWFD